MADKFTRLGLRLAAGGASVATVAALVVALTPSSRGTLSAACDAGYAPSQSNPAACAPVAGEEAERQDAQQAAIAEQQRQASPQCSGYNCYLNELPEH